MMAKTKGQTGTKETKSVPGRWKGRRAMSHDQLKLPGGKVIFGVALYFGKRMDTYVKKRTLRA